MQHFTVPISELDESAFEEGFGFDGSSLRGWKNISESDMIVVPDPTTAMVDPFMQHPTLVMICNVLDPITREDYARDPRSSIVDAASTRVTDGRLVKVLAWYDNEAGYSNRMVDLAALVGSTL